VNDLIRVRSVDGDPKLVSALANVLVDCVEGGASVGFMQPLDHERAQAYWSGIVESEARGDRLVFVAEEPSGLVVGTVQVLLSMPENQPHRGEIMKMLVKRSARRKGVANALMQRAENEALAAGKTLLVLDTASAVAERLYERRGWTKVGSIPEYALWPDGGFVPTTLYFKKLALTSPAQDQLDGI
jgi:GNAT superfamily N-acetyltransferase